MIYDRLTDIKTQINTLGLFASADVHLGKWPSDLMASIGQNRIPYCIIKSGNGELDEHEGRHLVHVFCVFRDTIKGDSSNIESIISENLRILVRSIEELDQVAVVSYTTDQDIFEPYGIQITELKPPNGGFRIDIEIFDIY